MNKVLCAFVLVLLFVPSQALAAKDGYSETVQWWQSVHQQMQPYSLGIRGHISNVSPNF